MTWDAPDAADYEAAIAWFRQRVPMTEDEFSELVASARERAFTVAGVAQLDVVQQVHDALEKAIATGTDLREFKKAVRKALENAWAGEVANPAWRIELIFRMNLQQAYAAGRRAQMLHPVIFDARPYWRFDAVLDRATTRHCRTWDGVVLPNTHRAWRTHTPPCHWLCRSAISSLTEEQAQAEGIAKKAPGVRAEKGFGVPPDVAEFIEPEANDYAPAIWAKRKTKEARR